MKEQTRKEMQQKMAEYEMSAPDVSWAEIEQAVGGRPSVVIPMRHKRMAAAVAVVLLMAGGGAGLWMQQHRQGAGESQQTEQVSTTVSETAGPHQQPTPVNPTNEPATYASATPRVRSAALPIQQVKSDERAEDENQVLTKENDRDEKNTHAPKLPVGEQPQPTTATPPSQPTGRPRLTTPDTRLTAKVYLGNSMNSYTGNTMFTPMLMSAKPFGKYDNNMDKEGDSPLPSIKTSIHHHQPLRFGLSLRYGIDKRWSVESGLSYSYHKSDMMNQSGDSEVTTEQRLSYIGIPLNVGYQIWSGGRFGFYISAGGMVEKMVKGSRTTQTATESVSIHPLQFSLNCAAGAEFRFDQSFSLYVEPGLSYHFDNDSPVPTIYQDEPLNLNLSVGLRFHF